MDITAGPIVASSGGSGDKNPLTAPTVDAAADSMLVALFGVLKKTDLSVPNDPGGALMSDVYFQEHQNGSAPSIRAGQQLRGAGPTGARLSTAGNEDKWVGQLVVLRGGDTQLPTGASITIDDQAAWTKDAAGKVTVDIAGSDNRGIASYRLADTKAGLDTAAPTTVNPAQTTFSKTDVTFTLTGAEGPSKAAWVRICDAKGNCADASDTIGWDKTGPVVTGTKTPAANGLGWHNTDVAIAWTATDAGAGLDSGPTPGSDSVTADTASVTKTATATDKLGNVGHGEVVVKLDETRPSIHPTRQPAPNAHGWNNTDVSVGFTCSDELSGIKSCTGGGTVTVTTEGAGQTTPGTAVDNADNENKDGVSRHQHRQDRSGPHRRADHGAERQRLVSRRRHDRLGGIRRAVRPRRRRARRQHDRRRGQRADRDRVGQGQGRQRAVDDHGPREDRPHRARDERRASDWTNAAEVTVELQPSDGLSGVASTTYSVDGGPAQSGMQRLDHRGGRARAGVLQHGRRGQRRGDQDDHRQGRPHGTRHHARDQPGRQQLGWHREDVTVTFICTDGMSGIASCTADQVVSEDVKDHKVTGTAVDHAGNSATSDAFVSLDKTAPTISAAVDRPNGNGWYNADVIVDFTCDDNLSGAIDCPAGQTLGEGENQSAKGSVSDAAGNSASDEVTGIDVDKTAPG